ncbi:MAG: hypothetical protein KA112_00960 [Alphaproteobacteria bacterium]|nr:hypothetical protein [Alphaproteobacteria bacterium]MBP7729170.1 hypothetical protein [Alphaproteobacteria bacterium]
MNNIKFTILVTFFGLIISQPIQANGFLGIYNGLSNAGVGGAGIAGGKITDASSINLNPALAMEVPNQITFSLGANYQRQKFDTSKSTISHVLTAQGGPVLPAHKHPLTNENKLFPSSFGGATHRLNDKIVSGCGMNSLSWGGGGGFVRYQKNIISPALPLISKSFNLAALTMPLTVAVQPTPWQSYGVSIILGLAGFQTNLAKSTNPFVETSGHNRLRMAGGLGARIGGKWNLSSQLSLGATLSSPVYFTKFDSYQDVLPHRIELPMQAGGGLTWNFLPTTELLVDITGYFWKLSKITNKTPTHGGFGWRNTFAVMTGINHKINDIWTFRLGYQYSMPPVRDKFLFENAFAAAHVFIKNIITTGFNVNITTCLALDGEIAYGFKARQKDPGTGPYYRLTRDVKMEASGLYALAGFTWKY